MPSTLQTWTNTTKGDIWGWRSSVDPLEKLEVSSRQIQQALTRENRAMQESHKDQEQRVSRGASNGCLHFQHIQRSKFNSIQSNGSSRWGTLILEDEFHPCGGGWCGWIWSDGSQRVNQMDQLNRLSKPKSCPPRCQAAVSYRDSNLSLKLNLWKPLF